MGRTGRRVAVVAVAVAALVSACSGDDSGDDEGASVTEPVETSESTTAEAPTTTEDPDAAVKAEVEEAYLAYWEAFLEIFSDPNPNNPLIEMHTAEAVRDATLDGVARYITEGRSVRPPADSKNFNITVLDVDLSSDRAELRACVVDGLQVVDNRSAAVINDTVATTLVRAETVLDGDSWKVAQSWELERREGVWDCA